MNAKLTASGAAGGRPHPATFTTKWRYANECDHEPGMAEMGVRRGIAQGDHRGGFGEEFVGKVGISCTNLMSARLRSDYTINRG